MTDINYQTKQVSWDLSPAMQEGVIRDKLIELGWATPEMYAEAKEIAKAAQELAEKEIAYGHRLREIIDEYDSLLNDVLEEVLPSMRLSAELKSKLDEGIHIPVSPLETAAAGVKEFKP